VKLIAHLRQGFEVNIITSTRPCNFHGIVLGTRIGCYRYVTLEMEWWKLGKYFDGWRGEWNETSWNVAIIFCNIDLMLR